jgi:hypothetical protein
MTKMKRRKDERGWRRRDFLSLQLPFSMEANNLPCFLGIIPEIGCKYSNMDPADY